MLGPGTGVASDRRHSSPVVPVKSDHVAEIARLIGLVSAESQRDGGGDDDSTALSELKIYVLKWPVAQATLEDQVGRACGCRNGSCTERKCYHRGTLEDMP